MITSTDERGEQMKTTVFLKPTAELLRKVEDLQTAIDCLIVNDCFQENNPMRKETGACLFWNWAILRVGKIDIPVPYHTKSGNDSVLYDWKGDEVVLSNEQCVYATAKFYLSHLHNVVEYMKTNNINPFISVAMSGGKTFITQLVDKFFSVLSAVDNKMGAEAWKVNN